MAIDAAAFWATYRRILEERTTADHGTGRAYDWSEMGTSRDAIPARCDSTVALMRQAMARYAPSFDSNAALKAAAKAHGYTSAAKLRADLLAAPEA